MEGTVHTLLLALLSVGNPVYPVFPHTLSVLPLANEPQCHGLVETRHLGLGACEYCLVRQVQSWGRGTS